jgi:N-acetylneuraminate synthase
MFVKSFKNHPVIIAEAGVNHNGCIERAFEMIDVAAEAKADIIKFQTFTAEECASRFAPKADYQKKSKGDSQFELLRQLELDFDAVKLLKAKAEKAGLVFLSTPDGSNSLKCLVDAGVKAIKIASGEVTNLPFLKDIARTKLPVILSTGMSNLGEVQKAVNCLGKNGCDDITLLHCTSQYPALPEDCNIRAIKTLQQAFGFPTGFSDHTEGSEAAILATSLGAVFIEKHFTLSRKLPGPDQAASIEPAELKNFVKNIRMAVKMLGTGIKKPCENERDMALLVRRSVVANCKIKEGQKISADMLACKRPANGIKPEFLYRVIGRIALKDLEPDQPLKWEMLGKNEINDS